ncbi:unnamed protein product, partial [Candidula unifasciata]
MLTTLPNLCRSVYKIGLALKTSNGDENSNHSGMKDINGKSNTDVTASPAGGPCDHTGEDGQSELKTNGQTSESPGPSSPPPSPALAPLRVTSASHSPDKGGHYHHHVSSGGGAEYYLSANPDSLGHSYIPASTSHSSSSPSDGCYLSSSASQSGGSGAQSPGENPGERRGSSPTGSQHVVHVHVNPGETFSVRLGDQIQHIQ